MNSLYFGIGQAHLQTSRCQPLFDDLASFYVRRGYHVAVGVNRSLNAGMSQPGRNGVDWHPRGQQDRRVGVPQVVEANALNPAPLQYLVERSRSC